MVPEGLLKNVTFRFRILILFKVIKRANVGIKSEVMVPLR